MAQKKIRPIYTEVGKIKPLGKTRRVKKSEARPWRPFRIGTYRLRERLKKPDELIVHRRPTGRPDVAVDPREAMAISKTRVRGTLPERIVYKKFVSTRRWIYFDFQSSLMGGRLQLGGIVADFILPDYRVIIRVQGPTHKTQVGTFKDKQQAQLLADMGYTVYDLDENICYDPMRLEEWFRRYIDKLPSVGGRMAISGLPSAGTVVFLATGEMNFAWTLQEHQRVERLEDMIINVQRDFDRIQAGRVITVNGLSDINTNLGLVQAGEFRVGNQRNPGSGFTGVRIGYPPFRYTATGISQDWHIVGVNNDILQFGLRATDGVAVAGGGGTMLSVDGLLFINETEGYWDRGATIDWVDLTQHYLVDDSAGIAGIGGYYNSPQESHLTIKVGGKVDENPYYNSWSKIIIACETQDRKSGTPQFETHTAAIELAAQGDDNTNENFGFFEIRYSNLSTWEFPRCLIGYVDLANDHAWLNIVGTNPKYSLGIDPTDDETFLFTSNLKIDAAGTKVYQINARTGQLVVWFNPDNRDLDFRIDGDSVDYLFFVDANADLVNLEYVAVHNYIDFEDKAAPATPGSGYGRLYVNSNIIWFKDDGGVGKTLSPLYEEFKKYADRFENSTAWNTWWEVTIPAATLGATDGVWIESRTMIYANLSSTQKYRMEVYDGTTTTYYPNATGINDSVTSAANFRDIWWDVAFFNNGATNTNEMFWRLDGDFGSNQINTSLTWDTASNNIRIRIQGKMDSASTNFRHIPFYCRAFIGG